MTLSKALLPSTLLKWLLDLTRVADKLLPNPGRVLCSHRTQAVTALGPQPLSIRTLAWLFSSLLEFLPRLLCWLSDLSRPKCPTAHPCPLLLSIVTLLLGELILPWLLIPSICWQLPNFLTSALNPKPIPTIHLAAPTGA